MQEEEKAEATVDRYVSDVMLFADWLLGREVDKAEVVRYKEELCTKYAPASINVIVSSLNRFFDFCGWHELRLKRIRQQRPIFASTERELTKADYQRLLMAAKNRNNQRLSLVMQTICSTGIRVSELRYITVEAVQTGAAVVNCKGKRRQVFLTPQLCRMLKQYLRDNHIKKGSVFVTKNGNPLNRSNIWADMKKLCETAGVASEKVFPHNLRHLFARTYYSKEKDIVRLADVLGHSSVNTTRIYTMESGEIHRQQLQRLGLLRC